MPQNSYLCDGNLPNFRTAVKLVLSSYLKRRPGLRSYFNPHTVHACFIDAKRYTSVYDKKEGKLSPYKEIGMLSYFIQQKKPIRLKYDPNFRQKIEDGWAARKWTIKGEQITEEVIRKEELYPINTHVAYMFYRFAFAGIQKDYISKKSSYEQKSLKVARASNLFRVKNIEKSVIASIKDYTGNPKDFASMLDLMLMIDPYDGKSNNVEKQ